METIGLQPIAGRGRLPPGRAAHGGVTFRTLAIMDAVIELMSRTGCSACARAEAELARILPDYGLSAALIDVDQRAAEGDPLPRAEYGDRVPVVVVNGVEHSYWEVDEPRLRADLDAMS